MKIRDLDRQAVVAAYRAGDAVKTIALRHGTHVGMVRRVLVAEGVAIRHPGPRQCQVDLPAVVADYRARVPLDDIARRHGISRHTLRERLADAGELAGRRRPDVDAAEIRRRQAEGQTIEEIARDVGLAASTLQRRLSAALGSQGQHTPLVARWQGRVPEAAPAGVSARNWAAFRRVVAGEPQADVARDLGVSRVRVGQIARAVDAVLRAGET